MPPRRSKAVLLFALLFLAAIGTWNAAPARRLAISEIEGVRGGSCPAHCTGAGCFYTKLWWNGVYNVFIEFEADQAYEKTVGGNSGLVSKLDGTNQVQWRIRESGYAYCAPCISSPTTLYTNAQSVSGPLPTPLWDPTLVQRTYCGLP